MHSHHYPYMLTFPTLHNSITLPSGDIGSYDYFTLGGPYSVRGYAPGELGAARRFVEAAAEVRVAHCTSTVGIAPLIGRHCHAWRHVHNVQTLRRHAHALTVSVGLHHFQMLRAHMHHFKRSMRACHASD